MTQTLTGAPIIVTPKKNIILDATVLSTIMSCGRLTDFRFNHNLQSVKGKSNSLEVGSLVHKVLEVTYHAKSTGVKLSDAIGFGLIAGQLYADGCPTCAGQSEPKKYDCGHSADEYPGLKNTAEFSEGHYVGWRDALNTCIEYFDYYKNDYWVTLETETVKGKVIYEDDEIRILWKAKIDWLVDTNESVISVDHKTQKQRRQKILLNNQFMGQCLVTNQHKMIINNIGFQKSLKAAEKFTREMMSYSSDQLLEWQSEIVPYWAYKYLDYIESGYFPPNFTHCENKYGNCPFIDVCSSNPNMREEAIRMSFVRGPEWNPTNEVE